MSPSAFVVWKVPIRHRILNAPGMRGAVIVSSTDYGDGGGEIPALLLGSPRDDTGNLIRIGAGQQHSSTVYVADLANLFRRVLEGDSARGYHLVGDGRNPTVAELTEPATDATGAPGAVPGSDEEARATLRRLCRRSPPARSGHACRHGSGRARVVIYTSRTRRRASPWQLQQAADGLNERLRNNDLDRNSDGG
jgi:nucleoside-diphosphate-sugar epimerase